MIYNLINSDSSNNYYDCYESCIENIYKKYKCFANPFTEENFILINSSKHLHTICNKTERYNDTNEQNCHNSCHRDCYQEYYSMSLDNHYYNLESDSKIKIKYKFSTVFHFSSEPQIPFVIYLSNIGGLFGLWFGLSFIDISLPIKTFLNFILVKINVEMLTKIFKKLFLKIVVKNHIIEKIATKIISIIKFLKLKFTLGIKIVSSLIILWQLFLLIETYLQFLTQTSVDLVKYRDITNNIPVNLLPSVMFCFKMNYDKILFNENNLRHINMMTFFLRKDFPNTTELENKMSNVTLGTRMIILLMSKGFVDMKHRFKFESIQDEIFENFLNIFNASDENQYLNKMEIINNKNISGFSTILNDFKIFNEMIKCNINTSGSEEEDCSFQFKLTPFGQCLTHHKSDVLGTSHTEITDKFLNNQHIFYGHWNLMHFHEYKLLFHSPDSSPVLTSEEFYLTDNIRFAKG